MADYWLANRFRIDEVGYLLGWPPEFLRIYLGAPKSFGYHDEKTALMYAAEEEDGIDLVRYLVGCGVDVNAVDENRKTALLYASTEKGSKDIVRCLVDVGADINAADEEGKTPLMYASGANYIIPFRYPDAVANTPVENRREYQSGSVEIVRYLVDDAGANVNAVDKHGKTALMYALLRRRRNESIVRSLIEAGADVNAVDTNGRPTLIYALVLRPSCKILRYLVDAGADVNAADKWGKTALMYASGAEFISHDLHIHLGFGMEQDKHLGNEEIVRYLVKAGSYLNAVDKGGRTALIHASSSRKQTSWWGRKKKMEIVRCLLHAGADVNATDARGTTVLMCAAECGDEDVGRCLVDGDADVNLADSYGHRALHFAFRHDNPAVQLLLLSLSGYSQNAQSEWHEAHSQSFRAWRISPFEIDLKTSHQATTGGVEFRAKWLDADVVVMLFVADAAGKTFADEVSVWRQLRHPNIIKLYGACDVGHHFFVAEFASNGSIVNYLTACKRSEVKATPWKFLHEAVLGLVFLHERQLIHGNLRGSNILVGGDGLAKLADFGFIGSTRSGTLSGVFGAARWHAPECVEGEKASFASDVYSLGLCIVEALLGKVPWANLPDKHMKRYKQCWDPSSDKTRYPQYYAPGDLTDDVRTLTTLMCVFHPPKRVTAQLAAQDLGQLAAREAAELRRSQPEPEPIHSAQWNELRSRQEKSFVSELLRILADPGIPDVEEDRIVLAGLLKFEIDTHRSNYTPDQQATLQEALDDIVRLAGTDAVTTMPEWFIHPNELVVDCWSCLG